MGGRKTSMSVRVMSSGYMRFVSSKRAWRRSCSEHPNRFAIVGRCHTGSIAALVMWTCNNNHLIIALYKSSIQSYHRWK